MDAHRGARCAKAETDLGPRRGGSRCDIGKRKGARERSRRATADGEPGTGRKRGMNVTGVVSGDGG